MAHNSSDMAVFCDITPEEQVNNKNTNIKQFDCNFKYLDRSITRVF